MQKGLIPKLLCFNGALAMAIILLYSPGFCCLQEKNTLLAAILAVLAAALFFSVNYLLLTAKPKLRYRAEQLDSMKDCRAALEDASDHPRFQNEVTRALRQIDSFSRKETALKAILPSDSDGPFLQVSEDVETCLLANQRRILNRIAISDSTDPAKNAEHLGYLHSVLDNSDRILSQFEALLIEISQIGDSGEAANLNLDAITEALRDLRTEGENPTAQPFPPQES